MFVSGVKEFISAFSQEIPVCLLQTKWKRGLWSSLKMLINPWDLLSCHPSPPTFHQCWEKGRSVWENPEQRGFTNWKLLWGKVHCFCFHFSCQDPHAIQSTRETLNRAHCPQVCFLKEGVHSTPPLTDVNSRIKAAGNLAGVRLQQEGVSGIFCKAWACL